MAVDQDLYDTLSQYFSDAPSELENIITDALSTYFNGSPVDFDAAIQDSLNSYFGNNPMDIDFSSNASFDSASEQVLSDYFNSNSISVDVDLSATNSKIDAVKTKVDSNLDAKISSIDLSVTNSKVDSVASAVSDNKTLINQLTSNIGGAINSVFYDANTDTTYTAKILFDAINQALDFSDVSYTIDGSNLDLSTLDLSTVNYNIDSSTLDLTPISDSVISVLSDNTASFLVNSSLNGNNGSMFSDGTTVNVRGRVGVYTVLSSQIVTTLDNNASYLYYLKDENDKFLLTVQDNLTMVPSDAS